MAAHSEDSVILNVAVLIQYQGVTDGRTDRRTDTYEQWLRHAKHLHAVARKNWFIFGEAIGLLIETETIGFSLAV